MRFLIIVPASRESESGARPDEKSFKAMMAFNEELVKAGVMLAGEGLQPTSKGARVRFGGGKQTVVDGPFTEAKELIAGFWIWQCKSKEEAVEWVKRAPFEDGVTIEIRPVVEPTDLTDSPELLAQEERLRGKIAR
jgi:hypothetical protein